MLVKNEDIVKFVNAYNQGLFKEYEETIFRYKISKLSHQLDPMIKAIGEVQPNREEILVNYLKGEEELKKEFDEFIVKTDDNGNPVDARFGVRFTTSQKATEFYEKLKTVEEENKDEIEAFQEANKKFIETLQLEEEIAFKPFTLQELPATLGSSVEVLIPFIEE